jgi:hypothetical protein
VPSPFLSQRAARRQVAAIPGRSERLEQLLAAPFAFGFQGYEQRFVAPPLELEMFAI